MSSLHVRKRITLAEFERLPVGPPYVEFEDGDVIELTSPELDHQDVIDVVNFATKQYVRQHALGRVCREVDVYLTDKLIYVPDLAFVANDNVSARIAEDRQVHGVPDLMVEAVSSNASRDRKHKFRVYETHRVRWYLIIDPIKLTAEEYRLTENGYLLVATTDDDHVFRPTLFPGLDIDLTAEI